MGYIGFQLYEYLYNSGFDCYSVDMKMFKGSSLCRYLPNLELDYSTLEEGFIQQFDAVILLAGHSSIPFCNLDPKGSDHNNVSNFRTLCSRLKYQTFIYASSASVYGSSLNCHESQKLAEYLGPYDRQKQDIDFFAQTEAGNRWYGLRFGTVCGYSSNPRNELMINSMVKSAILQDKVKVSSPNSYRAILGLIDLVRAIKHILDKEPASGYYNLASFNSEIGNLGEAIAGHFGSKLEVDNTVTSPYSFSLDTSKITNTGFEFIETAKLIAERCRLNDFSVVRDWNVKYSFK